MAKPVSETDQPNSTRSPRYSTRRALGFRSGIESFSAPPPTGFPTAPATATPSGAPIGADLGGGAGGAGDPGGVAPGVASAADAGSLGQGLAQGFGALAGGMLGGAIAGPPGAVVGATLGGKAAGSAASGWGDSPANDMSSAPGTNAAVADAFGDASTFGDADTGAPSSAPGDAAAVGAAFGDASAMGTEAGAGDIAGGDVGGGDAGGDGGGDGGGGCFITESVLAAGGQGDAAPEMQILKWFRDNVMLTNPVGQQMVQQYYVIAPLVVQAITMRPDAMQIFATVKSNFIDPAVQAIQAQNHQKALQIYADMLAFVTPFAIEAVTGPGGEADDRPMSGQEDLDAFSSQAAIAAYSPEVAGAAVGAPGMTPRPPIGQQPSPMVPGQPMANAPEMPMQGSMPPIGPGAALGGGQPAIAQFARQPQRAMQPRRY